MSVDVSIIVPVYNSEKYLPTCIESIINQSLRSIEIILVDDGSTDDSLRIMNEYRTKDERIIIIQQKNLYAGVARNNGLKMATGKYVIFLDSDDVFKKNMIKDAFTIAEKHDAEMVMFGNYDYHMDTGKLEKKAYPKLPTEVFRPRDIGKNMFRLTSPVPWNKLILRSFIIENAIYFQNTKTCNDEFFSRAVAARVERACYIRKRYVIYRKDNPKSLQGGLKLGNSIKKSDACQIIEKLYHFLQSSMLMDDHVKEAFIDWSSEKINMHCLMSSKSECALKELYHGLRKYLENTSNDIREMYQKEALPNLIIHSETYEKFLLGYLHYRDKEIKKTSAYRIGSRIIDSVPQSVKYLVHQYKTRHL